jgi:hypothetical protein
MLLNKPQKLGLLGVEVEVESLKDFLPRHGDALDAWNVTHDGSLRGESAEYVFKEPLGARAAINAVNKLRGVLEPVELNWSFRTSVHVHVNVLSLTQQQLNNFLYSYLLLEDVLMAFCGNTREGNRFCLRVKDAEGVVDALVNIIKGKGYLNLPRQDVNRYSSLNVDALQKFGSLEFRGMRGTLDKDVINVWINALVRLRKFAMEAESIEDIAKTFAITPDDEFLKLVFGSVIAKALTPADGSLSQKMASTYSLSMALLLAEKGVG